MRYLFGLGLALAFGLMGCVESTCAAGCGEGGCGEGDCGGSGGEDGAG